MNVARLSNQDSYIHKWVKGYAYRKERQGAAIAARYLRDQVPLQLQEQVVKTAEQLLNQRRRKTDK